MRLQPPESQLDACRRGDREAFRGLVEAWSARVHVIALRFCGGDEAAAREVVQQVFVKLWTSLGSFRGEAAFSTWLYRLVANACFDERRRTRRLAPLEAAAHVASAGCAPDEDAARTVRATRVQRALAELPADQRLVVLLRHHEDMGYDEMARALGWAPGTVASRLARAHRALASRLADLEHETP